MGQLGRSGEEDVLNDQMVQPGQQPPSPMLIGLGLRRILTDGVEGVKLTLRPR